MFEICGIGPLYVRAAITRPCNNNYSQLDPLLRHGCWLFLLRKFHRRFSWRRPRGTALGRTPGAATRKPRLALGGGASAAASCTGAAWHRRRLAPGHSRTGRGWRGRPRLGWRLAGLPERVWLWQRNGCSEAAPCNRKGTYSCLFISMYVVCERTCLCVWMGAIMCVCAVSSPTRNMQTQPETRIQASL